VHGLRGESKLESRVKAVIVGAGIGGLCAAIALARRGIDVEVLEQASVLAEAGAGLQLSPNAMKVLRALGLADRVAAHASAPEALELRLGRSGACIFSIPMGDAAERRYGAPYLHIHRADLQAALAAALSEAAPGALKLGVRAEAIAALEGDVIIGADGLRSLARRHIAGDEAPRFTGCVAWRLTAEAASVCEAPPPAAVVWTGAGRHAVTYRLRGGRLLNFVGVIEQDGGRQESWSEPGDLAELARAFGAFAAPVRAVIAAATACNRWALFDRAPLATWRRGNCTLLGDAAHPMAPFQAQGAAMAIEDAYVLARALAEAPSITDALTGYETARIPRTTRVLESARANARRFHHGDAPGQLATYGPMWIADRLAPGIVRSAQDWIYAFDATA
jgi:salicylate hydroxylase